MTIRRDISCLRFKPRCCVVTRCAQAAMLGVFALATASLSAQQALVRAVTLPESPGALLGYQASEGSASITGEVADINGGLVPGAKIRATEKNSPQVHEAVADSVGRFIISGVPAGSWSVTVSAPGLETFVSSYYFVRAGERFEVPGIALPIATQSTNITVSVTTKEIAEEQLHDIEKQRVFGVFPNFYTSFAWNATPLDASQKFRLSLHAVLDPVAFGTTAVVAGIEQLRNTFPDYGPGPAGYGKRYGAAFGDQFIGRVLGSAVFPAVFRQDPRYFYMGPEHPTKERVFHALEYGLITRGDNGRRQPNVSHIFGNAAAGAISSAYHPDSNSAGELALTNALIGIGGSAVQGLVREFLWSKTTRHRPIYGKGKPADAPAPVPETSPSAVPSK